MTARDIQAEQATELVEEAVDTMVQLHGLARADAGRAVLRALAAWYGIDFEREVKKLETEDSYADDE